jgi:hypothetical protein
VFATATRAMRRKELRKYPIIVMDWAMAKDNFRAIFRRRAILAARANTREMVLTAINLENDQTINAKLLTGSSHHPGSLIALPWASVPPSGMNSRQFCTNAHIEKAVAMGPNVPAINGAAVDANHQRL